MEQKDEKEHLTIGYKNKVYLVKEILNIITVYMSYVGSEEY